MMGPCHRRVRDGADESRQREAADRAILSGSGDCHFAAGQSSGQGTCDLGAAPRGLTLPLFMLVDALLAWRLTMRQISPAGRLADWLFVYAMPLPGTCRLARLRQVRVPAGRAVQYGLDAERGVFQSPAAGKRPYSWHQTSPPKSTI